MGIFGNIVKGFARAGSRVIPKIAKGVKSGAGRAFKGVKRGATRAFKGVKRLATNLQNRLKPSSGMTGGVREAIKKSGTSARIAKKAQERALQNLMNAP